MIKMISWNVNGIRAAEKKGLFEWMKQESPDILCLQETKAHREQLSEAFFPEGYEAHFAEAVKKGYSGTAVYSKIPPESVTTLGIEEFDDEGRTLVADFGEFVLINGYFPNSQSEGARVDYKIRYCEAIQARCDELKAQGRNVLVCGDYNVAHKPIDLANPKRNEGNPGYLPEERAWMDRFTDAGYVDLFREFDDRPDQYSWWSYRFKAREKNIGWRIDYFCSNPEARPGVKKCLLRPEVMGSDHCPVELHWELEA